MYSAVVKSKRRTRVPFSMLGVAVICAVLASLVARAALPPPDASPALKRVLGQYGSSDAPLTLYESGGRLMVDGHGLHTAALRSVSPWRYVVADGNGSLSQHLSVDIGREGQARAVTIGREHLDFVDVGQQAVDTIRAGAMSNVSALRAAALQAKPPEESSAPRRFALVDLTTVDPSIKLDIRYATSNNFMGFPLYEKAAAYLQRPAALAVGRAAARLAADGYGLLIHDAYRPWYVTRMFWDATPPSAHVFVADPAEGSRHNRGCAVDLTLYALATGKAVEMTGRYDEMSTRSFANFPGGTSRQRYLRDLLRSAMEAEGFTVYAEEWWHFDYRDWKEYGIGNEPFDRLAETTGTPQ